MPGAPNRPPEKSGEPTPPPTPESPERRIARRLAPSRIALSLDIWRGAPSAELVTPLEKAEMAFCQKEWREADNGLDQLAIRFAEPRWPTIPEPFRELRVSIPAPQPPQWDPEHALTPEEREARRARRVAETQVRLARASLEWAKGKGIDLADVGAPLEPATVAFAAGGSVEELYLTLDPLWDAVRARVPMPKPPAARPVPPKPPEPAVEEA